MAAYHNEMIDIDLASGTVHREYLNHQISEGDKRGHRFGFRAFRNGVAEDISGCSLVGYFNRANGTSVTINGGYVSVGTTSAYLILPEACFSVPGNFTLVIKLVTSSITSTVRIIQGTVLDTIASTLTDPGSTIPDLSDVTALLSDINDAADTIDGISISGGQISGTRYRIICTA